MAKKKEKLERCPFCGFDEYYVKCRMSGRGEFSYNFDHTVATSGTNTDMHDCLKYTENKTMYCRNCNKKLGIKSEPKRKGQ